MFNETITPGFSDTDALGHINNTRVPVWFENARKPIFKIFSPTLELDNWPLILLSMDVHFKQQIFYEDDVEIKTSVKTIGNSSFTLHQEVWQNEQCVASGDSTMVRFSYQTQKSEPISDQIRAQLLEHKLIEEDKT